MAADDRFAMPMAVSLHSALDHLAPGTDIEVYVLDAGLSAETRTRIEETARQVSEISLTLHWVQPDISLLEGVELDMLPRFSKAALYRLLIPEVLPATTNRALYLDSDLLVRADLSRLWEVDLKGEPMGAVQERTVGCLRFGVRDWERLGLNPHDPFFNSGVLLIDVAAWRAENIAQQVVDVFLDPEATFHFPTDQEGLNAVLAGRWQMLNPRWNAFHNYYYRPDIWNEIADQVEETDPAAVAREAHIVHFTSHRKPWLMSRSQPAHPMRQAFWQALWRSGWYSPLQYFADYGTLQAREKKQRLLDASRSLRKHLGLVRSEPIGVK